MLLARNPNWIPACFCPGTRWICLTAPPSLPAPSATLHYVEITLQIRSFASLIHVNALNAFCELCMSPQPWACFSLKCCASPISHASWDLQRVKSSLEHACKHFSLPFLPWGHVLYGLVLLPSSWGAKSFASCLYLPPLCFISDLEILLSFPCFHFWSPTLLLC